MRSGRIGVDIYDWMRDVERRLSAQERRSGPTAAADLMGPGLAPFSVRTMDWSGDETRFNGMFYSTPGALNSPDSSRSWMGQTYANEDGTGYQSVTEVGGATMPPPSYLRTFTTPSGIRQFQAWLSVGTLVTGSIQMWPTLTAPSGYLACDGSSQAVATYPALHSVIGYTFGGSGANFLLPDLRGRMAIGPNTGQTNGAIGDTEGAGSDMANRSGRLNHSHTHTIATHTHTTASNTTTGGTNFRVTGPTTHDHGGATGSQGLSTGNSYHAFLTVNFIIKA